MERDNDVRDMLIGCLLHMLQLGLGIKSATGVHALDQELNSRLFGPWADTLTTELARVKNCILIW